MYNCAWTVRKYDQQSTRSDDSRDFDGEFPFLKKLY